MAQTLEVIIKGEDGVSRIFKEVSVSATEAGNAVNRAGETGAKGADNLSKSVGELSSEMNEAAKAAVVVGGAITAAFAAPMLAGAKAAWNQVSAVEQATLALRAYEKDAGAVDAVLQGLLQYAQSDMGVLFSRQELFEAAQAMKLYGAETENLVEYVEILSRSVGLGLSDWEQLNTVVGRVGSTGRLVGNDFDYLVAAGFQLDESLRNTTVTWQELFAALDQGIPVDALAGQATSIEGMVIRMQSALRNLGAAFLGIDPTTSEFISGGLGDQLASSLQQVQQLLIAMQPAAASAGQVLGVVADAVSMAVDAFLMLPQPIQTGIASVTGLTGALLLGGGTVALLVPKIIGLVNSFKTLTSVTSSAVLALNPWVLGATAAIATGALLWSSYKDGAQATKTLEDAQRSLNESINEALLNGDKLTAMYIDNLDAQIHAIEAISSTRAADDSLSLTERLLETMTSERAASISASQLDIAKAYNDTRIDAAALHDEEQKLFDMYLHGEITLAEYDIRLRLVADNTNQYALAAEDATAAQERLNAALADGIITTDEFVEASRAMGIIALENAEINRRGYRDANESNRERRKTLDLWEQELSYIGKIGFATRQQTALQIELNAVEEESTRGRRRTAELIREQASDTQLLGMDTRDLATATIEAAAAQEAFSQALAETSTNLGALALAETATAVEDFNAHIETVTDNLNRLLAVSGFEGIGAGATNMQMYALEAARASDALDTVFRVTVSNTNAIANQSQGIADWAEELIGVQGEYSKLDDLVKAGRITGTSGVFDDGSEYAQAQRAFNDIQRENAEIQEHILTIQAKQAPLIRDQIAATEDYYQAIADMPAEQALITLGWMDSTTAARAMEFQTLAVAAATGQLGENGEEVFTSMITGAAQADPVLKALLIDMGLISEGADGTITVNFGGVEEGRSAIGALNETIGILIDLLDDGEINGSFRIDATDDASPVIRTARQNLADADGDSATMSLHLSDQASAGISAAQAALNALDGRVATSTVRTIYESQGFGPGRALGGVVEEYASGGVVIRAGEVGPEILHYANGGTAILPSDGLYNVPVGSYITPNHAMSNTYGGLTIGDINVYGGDSAEIKRVFTSEIVPALADLLDENRRTAGVA